MFLAYIRLIFMGSFVEITTAILLVYKILYTNNIGSSSGALLLKLQQLYYWYIEFLKCR
jgi:hypothetical protein